MKKILLFSLLLFSQLSWGKGDLGSVILNFDISNLNKIGAQSLLLSYSGKFDEFSLYFENQQDVIQKNTLQLSDSAGGVTLGTAPLQGMANGDLNLMTYVGSDMVPPHKKPCDLAQDFTPGTYNIIFNTEPAYFKNPSLQVGYWVNCEIIKTS